MTQLHAFTTGGAVGHKLIDGRVSAWWDKDGRLLDCERRNGAGRMCKPGVAQRNHLAAIGPTMVAMAAKAAQPQGDK